MIQLGRNHPENGHAMPGRMIHWIHPPDGSCGVIRLCMYLIIIIINNNLLADGHTCTLDILMHLPRSVFSQRQLDLFLWLLKVNDVDDVPSVKSMQTLNAMLQKMCGIDSIKYKGALGHTYYVNCLAQIIAQVHLSN
jgi:hypothetical protein